jgi:hypothetical protein
MSDPGFYEIYVTPIDNPNDSRVLARQIVSSNARGEQQLGSPNIVSDSGNARIRVKDATTNRVLMGSIGSDPSSATNPWGLKVSKAGFDVVTATDSQLIFNSQQNAFKIVATSTKVVTAAFSGAAPYTAQQTVAHGLSFAPFVVASVTPWFGPGYALPCPYDAMTVDATVMHPAVHAEVAADATLVYFNVITDRPLWDGIYTFRYYILQETAN